MKTSRLITLPLLALIGLAGCDEVTTASSAAPNAAEQACLAAVSNMANNGDVTLTDSSYSEAGTMVHVGVGSERAPWQCIAYSDGSTDGVMFLGEG